MDTITNRSNYKRMIVEFSGWIECNLDNTWFHYIGNDLVGVIGGDELRITARSYMKLPPEEQDNFILESLGEAYISSLDGELNHCDIEIEEL